MSGYETSCLDMKLHVWIWNFPNKIAINVSQYLNTKLNFLFHVIISDILLKKKVSKEMKNITTVCLFCDVYTEMNCL